ncbi:L-sorbose 1-dehydrogenase [Favolaschia claudopus]|uniref:L-sorbose 1-dehydrogenase n=1 Tax=Favolaschia claudopus TaxID=2862362 RepID=A0AAW0C2V6_9AGAR
MSDSLTTALNVLDKFRRFFDAHPRTVLSSVALAALLLTLRFVSAKKRKGKYIEDLSQVGSTGADWEKFEYDVIVVGGGTSGCVLAARLTEDPSIRVLMLEAGGSGSALPASRIPIGFSGLFRTKHVYGFRTEPQVHAKGQKRFFPRAKMLGGCSSINAQMAQYGAPGDFDEWAALTNDDSWSWQNFGRYFSKFEKYIPDPNYPGIDMSERGSSGPVRVGYFNRVSDHSKAFLKACAQVGIPLVPDFNGSKGPIGASRIMTYVDSNGRRVSSETAYLTNDVLKRPNLKVVINAQVTRLLFDQSSDGTTRAVGVEFANSPNGPRYKARARKDVIISAGAIHSPHILMLSGVGPAAQLKAHGIPVVLDTPGVGANLVDHPVVDLYLKDKTNNSIYSLRPETLSGAYWRIKELAKFVLFGKGMLTTNLGESAAFVRSDNPVLFPPAQYPQKLEDSTSGAASPDLELFCTPVAFKDHGAILFDMHSYALHCYLVRPTSRGSVLLTSPDPWALPSVDPNYLQSPDDLEKLTRGFRLLLNIAHAKAMDAYLDHDNKDPELDHATTHMKTDDELRELVRERVETVYHPASTCRMAPREKGGVVDSRLRVYGIQGLRVCDASIFPWIVSGHTAGACFAAGEKLADDMKKEYRGSK